MDIRVLSQAVTPQGNITSYSNLSCC